jgi:hypothetical protein
MTCKREQQREKEPAPAPRHHPARLHIESAFLEQPEFADDVKFGLGSSTLD